MARPYTAGAEVLGSVLNCSLLYFANQVPSFNKRRALSAQTGAADARRNFWTVVETRINLDLREMPEQAEDSVRSFLASGLRRPMGRVNGEN